LALRKEIDASVQKIAGTQEKGATLLAKERRPAEFQKMSNMRWYVKIGTAIPN
jgi:hypothetical protein